MVRPGQQVAASGVPVDGANSTLERVLDTLGAVMELLQVPSLHTFEMTFKPGTSR